MKLGGLIVLYVACSTHPNRESFVPNVTAGQAESAQLYNETGKTNLDGRSARYLIRRLPVNSFPDLPPMIAEVLRQRGCLIPQTYQAHHPENVVHASFERPGSTDWAVLCSVQGNVELLVFFAHSPSKPDTLATVPELRRLQPHDSTGILGFDWGIDAASPKQIHDAQAGAARRGPWLDHDALVDNILNQKAVYNFYTHNGWTRLNMPE